MRRPGLVAGPFLFSYYFYSIGLRETKMPNLKDLFLACKGFRLFGFLGSSVEFGGFWGLTCDFAGINDERQDKGKSKGNNQSLRPSGFAPAFGRAVGRFAAGRRGAEAPLYLRSNSKGKGSEATARVKASATAGPSTSLRMTRFGFGKNDKQRQKRTQRSLGELTQRSGKAEAEARNGEAVVMLFC